MHPAPNLRLGLFAGYEAIVSGVGTSLEPLPGHLARGLVRAALVAIALAVCAQTVPAAGVPAWLPRYDLDIQLDVAGHSAQVRERVTWTNRHDTPATQLVFNVHSHYEIPKGEVGYLAKTLEILRLAPSDSMDFGGPACQIDAVRMLSSLRPEELQQVKHTRQDEADHGQPQKLDFHFQEENSTALVVPLPSPVSPGESVTVELDFTFRLPQKQGRWGQWKGVTYLTNWLPVLAFFDDKGWQPTPFIPWHQPWFNEAGVYHAKVTLPADQKVA